MANILTSLTEQAVAIFNAREKSGNVIQNPFFNPFLASDLVLQGAQQICHFSLLETAGIAALIEQIFSDPEFSTIAPKPGELDAMVFHGGGGTRVPANAIIKAIFTCAFQQIYFLRQQNTESVYVRNVLEGFEELRRAIRGEKVRSYTISGVARLSLPDGSQITTPWGIIKPAPATNGAGFQSPWQPITTCILAEPKLLPVIFDRSPEPTVQFDPADQIGSQSHYLFPLACALASKEPSKPVVPLITWTTSFLPFIGSSSYSTPLLPPSFGANEDFGERAAALEEWARIVEKTHSSSIDVAARRAVSAVAHRMDRSDALIDAVMVWENLLGTSSEVTFRVSASLAKLIEKDPTKRFALRKRLSDIYAVRSRLVHGAPIDAGKIESACVDAIDVAIQALCACYKLGPEWLSLSSNERSDKILLEWQ